MSLAELRTAWAVVAILHLGIAAAAPDHAGLVIGFGFLLATGPVLWREKWAVPTARALAALGDARSARFALVLDSAMVLLVAFLCGATAASSFLLMGLTVVVVSGAAGSPMRTRERLVAATVATAAAALGLGAAEAGLHLPLVARRLGTPAERAAWGMRYDRLWETNVLHIRSPYETVAHTPSVGRIVAIGDSYTWGDKIALTDSTWPAALERDLDGAGRYPIEVINLAERGFTTANEAEMLRRLGWQFAPDLVVVQYLVNDALPSKPNFGSEGESWLWPERHLLPYAWRGGPAGSSALLDLGDRMLGRFANRIPDWDYDTLYQHGFAGWKQLTAALDEMGRASRARGVPVVLMLFPEFLPGTWTAGTHPHRMIHERVARAAAQAGLRVFDLTPVFAREGGDWSRWWATPYDGHPSAAADAIVARALADYLRREGLTPHETPVTPPAFIAPPEHSEAAPPASRTLGFALR